MVRSSQCLLAGLGLLVLRIAADGAEELTEANFDAKVHGGKNAFVKFLAPW
jgi:hypothetical protein